MVTSPPVGRTPCALANQHQPCCFCASAAITETDYKPAQGHSHIRRYCDCCPHKLFRTPYRSHIGSCFRLYLPTPALLTCNHAALLWLSWLVCLATALTQQPPCRTQYLFVGPAEGKTDSAPSGRLPRLPIWHCYAKWPSCCDAALPALRATGGTFSTLPSAPNCMPNEYV
jgi:hypothetical protein